MRRLVRQDHRPRFVAPYGLDGSSANGEIAVATVFNDMGECHFRLDIGYRLVRGPFAGEVGSSRDTRSNQEYPIRF